MSIAPLAGLGLGAYAIYDDVKDKAPYWKVHDAVIDLTGFSIKTKRFDMSRPLRFWGPVAAGMIVHKVANWAGINRILARMKLPFRL